MKAREVAKLKIVLLGEKLRRKYRVGRPGFLKLDVILWSSLK
jgi:hypothetical protein